MVGRVPEVTCCHRRSPATLQHLSRYAELPAPFGGIDRQTQREGSIMNWSNIETGWADFKANAKQQWGKLSEQQIDDTLGKREQLSASVQLAYAMSKDEAERQISEWQSKQVEKKQPSANS